MYSKQFERKNKIEKNISAQFYRENSVFNQIALHKAKKRQSAYVR